MRKKGVFFSIDALIAVTILLLTAGIIYPVIKYSERESYLQSDLMVVLSSLKVGEINNSYIKNLISQGKIKDLNNSLLEQIGEFYVENLSLAQEFTNQTLSDLEIKDNIGIWFGNKKIFIKNSTPYEISDEVDVETQIITGINEGENVTGFSARAYLSSDVQSKYFYFGGFMGEGNISVNISYNGNISDIYLEIAVNKDFDIDINGIPSGHYTNSSSEFVPVNYSLNGYRSNFNSGSNIIKLYSKKSGNNLYIAGGYIKITYGNSTHYLEPTMYQFPGIEGIINLYDGFYIPGNITKMEAKLHYNSSYEIFLNIGNITVYNGSSSGETVVILNDSYLSSLINYNSISDKTIPLRLGLKEIFGGGEGGNADVILITDLSSSMTNRLNSDLSGTQRDSCNDPLINDSTTQRISLAKCLDKNFTATVLSGPGNKIGLVGFSTNADNYINLTNNITLLNNTINSYSTSGYTCISCAINRAYKILQWHSSPARKRFIVVMSDGQPNRRSTSQCVDLYSVANLNENEGFAGGVGGLLLKRNSNAIYDISSSNTSNQINDLDFFNSTFGFGFGNSGNIIKWNGSSWNNISTPTSNNLRGIDFLNGSFAIGVGFSGIVLKWNGTKWSSLTTITNSPDLYSVSIYNSSLIFAAGIRSNDGKIYKSIDKGLTWTEEFSINNRDLVGIKIINSTTGFAVGESGHIIKIDRGTYTDIASPTTQYLYAVDSYNSTRIYIVGGSGGNAIILYGNGGSFSSVISFSSNVDSLRDIYNFNNSFYSVGDSATIYENNGSGWARTFKVPVAYMGNSTTGLDCSDDAACDDINNYPSLNANYSSCRANRELNSKIYSIGFGPVGSCFLGNITLKSIADCGNGTYNSSTDAKALQNLYNQIAYDILKLSYPEQATNITGNIYTKLYPDSYIEFNYSKNPIPYGLIITFEKRFYNSYNGSFSIPINTTIIETKVVSYSGPRWTDKIIFNNNIIYNLSSYGHEYSTLGDPYNFAIPKYIVLDNNDVTLTTAIVPGNSTEGSSYNKIIYTIIRNLTSYNSSALYNSADGCIWNLEFEDTSTSILKIPEDYTGTDNCYYKTGRIEYDYNDAVEVAVYNLLKLLDIDSNDKIDVKILENNFKITTTQINGLPYTWWTPVQIRRWK